MTGVPVSNALRTDLCLLLLTSSAVFAYLRFQLMEFRQKIFFKFSFVWMQIETKAVDGGPMLFALCCKLKYDSWLDNGFGQSDLDFTLMLSSLMRAICSSARLIFLQHCTVFEPYRNRRTCIVNGRYKAKCKHLKSVSCCAICAPLWPVVIASRSNLYNQMSSQSGNEPCFQN